MKRQGTQEFVRQAFAIGRRVQTRTRWLGGFQGYLPLPRPRTFCEWLRNLGNVTE